MKCPKCGTTEDLKWFLRHQPEKEDESEEESTLANVITILCTKCGNNQSYFIKDCLDDIFSEWKEINLDLAMLMGGNMNFPINSEFEDTIEGE